MSKKIMVLALAVVSAAFFALPAMASAQEIHFEPAEKFTIAGSGGVFGIQGESTMECSGTGGSGKFDTGSTTTGAMTLDFTGCFSAQFGFKSSCKSVGAATAGTIASGGTFHLITISSGVPGVLLTMNTTVFTCTGNVTFITTSGNVIGTITSPKCGESSKTVTLSFAGEGTTQRHLTYTGVKYDLVSKTESGEDRTSALEGTATNTQATAGKLNCT